MMLKPAACKYRSLPPDCVIDQTWPNVASAHPPIGLNVDLHDGNQASIQPKKITKKPKMSSVLLAVGFKKVEVGFASASQSEFDFFHQLSIDDLISHDVITQALTIASEPTLEGLT